MTIKFFAFIFLFLSGIFASNVESFGQVLCIYEYLSPDSITYFSELYGSSANDPEMIKFSGLLAIIFSFIIFLPLMAVPIKFIYASMLLILLVSELVVLNMIDALPYKELIYDSIVYCTNYALILWVLCKAIFLFLSGYYLFKYEEY